MLWILDHVVNELVACHTSSESWYNMVNGTSLSDAIRSLTSAKRYLIVLSSLASWRIFCEDDITSTFLSFSRLGLSSWQNIHLLKSTLDVDCRDERQDPSVSSHDIE